MLPNLFPFRGWKVLPLFCRDRPEWPPILDASIRFFSCKGRSCDGRGSLVVGSICPAGRVCIVNELAGKRPSWDKCSPSGYSGNEQRLTAFIQSHFFDVG